MIISLLLKSLSPSLSLAALLMAASFSVAPSSAQASAAAGGDEVMADGTTQGIPTLTDLPADVLGLIAEKLSTEPLTEYTPVGPKATLLSAAWRWVAKPLQYLTGSTKTPTPPIQISDWGAFLMTSKALRKATLAVGVPVDSRQKLTTIHKAPPSFTRFCLGGVLVPSIPLTHLDTHGKPTQILKGSVVVLGGRADIEAARKQAVLYPGLKVTFVMDDRATKASAGASAAAALDASTDTFTILSLNQLWIEELAREGSLATQKRALLANPSIQQVFDKLFALFMVNAQGRTLMDEVLKKCKNRYQLYSVLYYLKSLPYDEARSRFNLLQETGAMEVLKDGEQLTRVLYLLKGLTHDEAHALLRAQG